MLHSCSVSDLDMFTTQVPSPPLPPREVIKVSTITAAGCWGHYLNAIIDAAWREKSMTCDERGDVMLYAKLSPHDRALLHVRTIEEIWIVIDPLSEEEG